MNPYRTNAYEAGDPTPPKRWYRRVVSHRMSALAILACLALSAFPVQATPTPSLRVNGIKFPDGTNSFSGVYNVRDPAFGAVGDGSTDDTTAIQAAITACPVGGVVYLPPGTYKITAALTVTKSLKIMGAGVSPVYVSLNTTVAFDVPVVSPFLTGSVIMQATAATDAIDITLAGARVDLEDFGVRFADAIRHVNTGHGIVAQSSTTYLTGHDHGLCNAIWRNVIVFGTDGNHYGFFLMNPLLVRLDTLKSYGGGGFYIESDSFGGNYGNVTATDTYAEVYCNGTSHGYALKGRTSGTPGVLNLMVFIRPQAIVESATSFFAETTAPTTAQKLFTTLTHNVDKVSIIGPDFESFGITSGVDLTCNGKCWIDPTGIFGGATGQSFQTVIKPNFGSKLQFIDGRWSGKNASAGTPTAGANAGTSPPAPVAGTDNSDERGAVTFGTGTTPAAGIMVRIPYSGAQGGNQRVMCSSQNSATQALGVYCSHDSTGINVNVTNAPAASQANTTYSVEYSVTL